MKAWLAGVAVALLLAGCAGSDDGGRPVIGTRTDLCGQRIDAASAQAVIGAPVTDLSELDGFKPGERVGECALTGPDGGALLSVQVVHDPQGKKLAEELQKLSEDEDYTGDDHSGVNGEGQTTTALWAIDEAYYVRVLGLGGTSQAQRAAALAMAEHVAKESTPLR